MKRDRSFSLERLDEKWSDKELRNYFNRICDKVLNGSLLKLKDKHYKFREIEVYCNGGNFCDEFTHGDEMQKKAGCFYFHKNGKKYKGGTYKGTAFSTYFINNVYIQGLTLPLEAQKSTEVFLFEQSRTKKQEKLFVGQACVLTTY